ncbi:MAG TPA: hypothetical protein DCY13_15210 [Verrucomicrobiales bacterium]|nr:hypothetical protein [Verrucomicrobiales bacterium]
MKHTRQVIALLAGATLAAGTAMVAVADHHGGEKKNPKDIHDVMEWTHKGRESMVAKVRDGNGTAAEIETLLRYYKFMATQKPPQGDEAAWKERTAALVAATEKLAKKSPDAIENYKKAVNCKACHDVHKPKDE